MSCVRHLFTAFAAVLLTALQVNAQQQGETTSFQPSLTNSVVTVKSSKMPLIYYSCYNPNGSDVYIQLFDKASSGTVTLGMTVANRVVLAPALSDTGPQQLTPPFAAKNGLQIAATTSPSGSAAPAAPINCEFGYR